MIPVILLKSLDQDAHKKATRNWSLVAWILKHDTQLRLFSTLGSLLHVIEHKGLAGPSRIKEQLSDLAEHEGLAFDGAGKDRIRIVEHLQMDALESCRAAMAHGELTIEELRHRAQRQNRSSINCMIKHQMQHRCGFDGAAAT